MKASANYYNQCLPLTVAKKLLMTGRSHNLSSDIKVNRCNFFVLPFLETHSLAKISAKVRGTTDPCSQMKMKCLAFWFVKVEWFPRFICAEIVADALQDVSS